MVDQPSDSAGVPWQGRTLPQGGFTGDEGAADPGLQQALEERAAGRAGDEDVVAALASARLMVPVVAVLGEGVEATHGTADKQADMALVTLTSPDGVRALPVFSSLSSLAQWDATARPVPVEARRAAVSAVAEGCDVMVLDPSGPVSFVVGRPALWALGQGRPWLPAHRDPDVQAALRDVAAAVRDVDSLRGEPGEQAELRVVVAVSADLDRAALQALGARVGEHLQASDVVRERVDGVELALVRSPAPTDG
ncbi:MAG TPA: SseB family protein [Angustibacter sp.]|nr:SseB family protein [Angustibacter sp.]